MIISHERRFIFLKTRKTAGSSIELFLLDQLGPGDVVGTKSYCRNDTGRWNPLREIQRHPIGPELRLTVTQWCRGERYYEHMPAWRARERVGHEIWSSYYKFCFERDPWDKVVSFYWWRTRDMSDPPDFETFVRTTPRLSAWDQYTIDGELAVDFVGRYENLEQDLSQVLDRVGISAPVELEHEKSSYRRGEPEFSTSLDAYVAHLFRHEIDRFGYPNRSLEVGT